MTTAALSGNDTININGRIFNDFADGDIASLSYPNELIAMKVGKNGNTLYSFNETGKECDLTLRVIRGSADDKFLNNVFTTMKQDFSAFTLLTGELIKRIGDGSGNITRDIYSLTGGVITKPPEAKSNVEGDTEQSIVLYTFKFSNAPRTLG